MIRQAAIFCLLTVTGMAATTDQPDIMRFINGDQLHGGFQGIKDGSQVVWQRDDLSELAELKTTQIRSIALRGGRPLRGLSSLLNVVLANGDRVPGTITAIDNEFVTLDTSYADVLHIPRRQVAMLCPNPRGGRVYYLGPFSEDGWKMIHPSFHDGLPAEKPGDKDAEDQPGRWIFSGSAWYWSSKRLGTALIHEGGMSDRTVLSFDLSWKNQLALSVAFLSDFARPKLTEDEKKNANKDAAPSLRGITQGDVSQLPRLFGNSFVLQLHSNFIMLNRTRLDANGNPVVQRVHLNNSNIHLTDRNQARIELRVNRQSGFIALFIDEEAIAQWGDHEAAGAADGQFTCSGSGFGFLAQGADSPVRISDVVVSEWNGMPDSARSFQTADQDVILMCNGTDRFAGHMEQINDQGRVLFKGKHGELRVPLDEIAEIRFARDRVAPAAEDSPDNLTIHFSPLGVITGRPISGGPAALEIDSPVLGKLKVLMESAVFIDFNTSKQRIDDWYVEF